MDALEQVRDLYDQQLYSNVTCLVNLLLSISDNNSEFLTPAVKLQLLIWHAECFYEQCEYRKAESVYQKALRLKKLLLKNKGKTQTSYHLELSDVDVKYNIYLCHVSLKQFAEAITVLEGIPGKQRTVKINMALAKLYQQTGMERSAVTGYKEVLKECPLALDAALGLLSLGVKGVEVGTLIFSSTTGIANMDWLSTWIKAHSSLYSREFPQAISCFEQLDVKPLHNSVDVLVALGEAHYHAGDYKQSMSLLSRAHTTDPLSLKGMDIYALLLAKEKQLKDLEKLATQLMTVSEHHAEPWIAFGAFVMLTKISAKARYYAHKATLLNPRSVEAFLLKGKILLADKKVHEAVIAFREALRLAPYNFEAHQGLVNCYIDLHRTREALTIASNACKHLGQTPRTLSLYASVWAVDTVTVDKAEAYLEKALKQDPTNLDVIFQLAELYRQERRSEKGIELLMKQVAIQGNSRMHHMLADFYTFVNDTDKAMEHFSAAINLDNCNRKAIEGLQRAEQLFDSRGPACILDFDIMPDSGNEAELAESEVEGVWSD